MKVRLRDTLRGWALFHQFERRHAMLLGNFAQ